MFAGYFLMTTGAIEPEEAVEKKIPTCSGIDHANQKSIALLSFMFACDALAGAFIVQSFLSFYYQEKYDRSFEDIGVYLFICNVIAGISGILSAKLVHCMGAMATMIYTHLPSNIFLILIFLTDNPTLSIGFLFARFCISQMDVPARQTFVTTIVSPSERSAANGITNVARSVGLCIGLACNGYFMRLNSDASGFSVPFLIAGCIKIFYDIALGLCFLWNRKKDSGQNVEVNSMELSEEVTANDKESQRI